MANVQIDNLASEVMKGLMEYKDLVTSDMKVAVRKAGRSVKKDIQANAPKKYQLAHLLEKGHAKRGGGRTKAVPHIAPAEESAVKQLESDIKKAIGGS